MDSQPIRKFQAHPLDHAIAERKAKLQERKRILSAVARYNGLPSMANVGTVQRAAKKPRLAPSAKPSLPPTPSPTPDKKACQDNEEGPSIDEEVPIVAESQDTHDTPAGPSEVPVTVKLEPCTKSDENSQASDNRSMGSAADSDYTSSDENAGPSLASEPVERAPDLLEAASRLRALPPSALKEAAQEMLVDAAKKLEKAESAEAALDALKEEEKALIQRAFDVRCMPEGDDKVREKEALLHAAKSLEEKQQQAEQAKARQVSQANAAKDEAFWKVLAAEACSKSHDSRPNPKRKRGVRKQKIQQASTAGVWNAAYDSEAQVKGDFDSMFDPCDEPEFCSELPEVLDAVDVQRDVLQIDVGELLDCPIMLTDAARWQ